MTDLAAGGRVVRGVLFDVDGTLYHQRPLQAFMAAELLTLPFSASPAQARRRYVALRAYRAAQEQLRWEGVADPALAQLSVAAERSGLAIGEVEELVDTWMFRRPLKYLRLVRRRGLDELLASMASAGVRVGVLTDYPADAKLEALGFGGRFDPVLCAQDPAIKAFKPDPRGFLRACEIWGLEPSEVLVVGDRADVDAAGAAAAGMPCVIVGGTRSSNAAATSGSVRSMDELRRLLFSAGLKAAGVAA